MSASIIDGKAVSAALLTRVAAEAARLRREHRLVPGLAAVLVGEDPASEVYVRNKAAQAEKAGLLSVVHRRSATIAQDELLALVRELNGDPTIHGILVQLPLPKHIHADSVIGAIDPDKDVDGFHPANVGRLATGLPGLAPSTPLGCIILAKSIHPSLGGLEAVVVGRSNIVGKPLAQLLLAENATVTVAHSRTRDLAATCRRAELLFVAIGRPRFVQGDWIRPGATVIDVGVNRIADGNGKTRLVGDVDYEAAREVAGAITPVPGGVGPMTISCLLVNTIRAACALSDLPPPAL